MSSNPEDPASRSADAGLQRERARAPRRGGRAQRVVAVGFMQLVSLVGVIGVAVVLGAVLVDSAKITGWIVGLVIGAASVILTMLVLFSGHRARKH
jgi:hypothetical protein